jgi:hypothetical protein
MPNINTIPIPTFTGIEPYHFLFDNLPISAIAVREEMINNAVELNSFAINSACGSRATLALRLEQSLNSDGTLKTNEVDATLHNIGYHEDGSYLGVDYVRMLLSERQKLDLIQDEANKLTVEFQTISNAIFFPDGNIKFENSESLEWIVSSPNHVTAQLKFPREAAHQHFYGVTPAPKYLIPDYKNFTTGLSKPIAKDSLRVFLNGVQIYSDISVNYPSYDPNTVKTWYPNYFTVENDGIGFYLNAALTAFDVIKIDFDIPLMPPLPTL